VILALQVLLLMDAMLIAQSKMDGIVMEEMTLMLMFAMNSAVILTTMDLLSAKMKILLMVMAALLIVKLKTDGIAIFQ
jgi:hypothetical protein